ncbi:hypothetical protein IM793_20185 [Pedobacter sp. MR2016-19]|uniref:hypothetical protein n=1 Tax=Pedobacter sp. MR2016-19 TaxID=2780089 RepID=UPI0018771536|nr:hypothetical protein [Pedobacter sp. MR2016-19]MBE5321493.1 hypothetical protein [Pedobacter sp. MR2016-19]
MKQYIFSLLVAILILSGCTINYYLTVSDIETPIYSTTDGFEKVASIEAGKAFLSSGKSSRTATRYGLANGYSPYIVTWKPLKKLTKKQLAQLSFTTDYGYTYSGVPTSDYRYGRLFKTYPTYTPSATPRSTTKSTGSSGGTVHVKGYTRKDGTYVKPHTRSAPRRH